MKTSQKTVNQTTKAIIVTASLGTLTETIAWAENYLLTANVTIEFETTSNDPDVPPKRVKKTIPLAQLETDFSGIIAQLTAIADHYNPVGSDG